MWSRLKTLWVKGLLTVSQLSLALAKKWITQEEYDDIVNTPRVSE